MNKSAYITLLVVLLLSSSVICFGEKQVTITLQNTAQFDRQDELIVISKDNLVGMLGKINDEQSVLVMDKDTPLPSQLDDMNLDGQWDELAFLCSFLPGQMKEIILKVVDKNALPKYPIRTNVRYGKPIKQQGKLTYLDVGSAIRVGGYALDSTKIFPQFEGPGWENDKVAFRNYFDERNGIDIFGKTTDTMVLDQVGYVSEYHHLQPWGMDILKVGKSLGAGSIAIMYNDQLYRVSAIEGTSFRKITEGPVRAILDLDFNQVKFGKDSVTLKHRISITAGSYAYVSTVFLVNPSVTCNLATGIVNLHSNNLYTFKTDSAIVFYTYDKQSENADSLGMALIIGNELYTDNFRTPDTGDGITNTYAVKLKPDQTNTYRYAFYGCWEKSDPSFDSRITFETYLKEEATHNMNPIKVALK